jgi:hypothetical protein
MYKILLSQLSSISPKRKKRQQHGSELAMHLNLRKLCTYSQGTQDASHLDDVNLEMLRLSRGSA